MRKRKAKLLRRTNETENGKKKKRQAELIGLAFYFFLSYSRKASK